MSAPIEDKLFVREHERKDGSVLKINQCEVGDVGCVVWDAALVLTSYLETEDFVSETSGCNKLMGKRVIELGSGTGIVGLQAACLGAECTITDLPEFVPLMELNIRTNESLITGHVTAKSLTWGQNLDGFPDPVDYLFFADCIYYAESLEPLVKTINDLSNKTTSVYCCYEKRTSEVKLQLEKKFFELIKKTFSVEEIPHERQDGHYQSPDIHIMLFKKR